jgi:hypothetical protein
MTSLGARIRTWKIPNTTKGNRHLNIQGEPTEETIEVVKKDIKKKIKNKQET